ncbi:response regulator [Niveibacterium sp. 24ML]|uniref:response regulator n=1 Tax=Niveibacterium sp. 24ML TaxID=2985512 RepID=UPI002271847F|nr:response regulator [Niveibacterium sp. 24ML]MCX9157846.1 response regulator [Niveibacterium sp. 24ML]
MPRARILVVDDEPFNLEIICDYLEDCDYQLDTTQSGAEALAWLEDAGRHYDVLVLDRMMPDISGMEVLRQVKQHERLKAIPVIMQTAAATPDQVREGLAAGAHYYLTKPFEADSLQAVIRTALDDQRRRAELSARINEHIVAMQMIERAEFSVRSLEEAAAVATTAALVCPRPEAVAMGLAELLVNGVEHGNLGIDFVAKGALKESGTWADEVNRRLALPEHAEKRVRLTVAKEGGRWHFHVRDDGPGFDWQRFIELDPARAFAPNGRGIVLAKQIAFDEVTYAGSGNEVHAWLAANTEGTA